MRIALSTRVGTLEGGDGKSRIRMRDRLKQVVEGAVAVVHWLAFIVLGIIAGGFFDWRLHHAARHPILPLLGGLVGGLVGGWGLIAVLATRRQSI